VPAYRLYHLDGSGRVDSAEWLEAADDAAAADQAGKRTMKAMSAELWQGKRRVACLNQDGVTWDGAG
jgi:hypothetical protein